MIENQPSIQNLQQRIAELEQERVTWYAQRDQLIADMEEQASHISDAWQRLESQRRVNMQAEANSAARTHSTARSARPASAHAPVIDATQNKQPRQSQNSANPTLADQFRTLQREVQNTTAADADDHRSSGETQ